METPDVPQGNAGSRGGCAETEIILEVQMSCQGCANAVEKALKKIGIQQIEIDLAHQKVTVKGNAPLDVEGVLKALASKKATLWEANKSMKTEENPVRV